MTYLSALPRRESEFELAGVFFSELVCLCPARSEFEPDKSLCDPFELVSCKEPWELWCVFGTGAVGTAKLSSALRLIKKQKTEKKANCKSGLLMSRLMIQKSWLAVVGLSEGGLEAILISPGD